jgi:hypothetical protein
MVKECRDALEYAEEKSVLSVFERNFFKPFFKGYKDKAKIVNE